MPFLSSLIISTDLAAGLNIVAGSASGITAFAGGGQTNATPLTQSVNRVTTVATAGDSVKLPAAQVASNTSPNRVVIINRTSNPLQVFGTGTDTINGVAAATGIAQPANSAAEYICGAAGLWETAEVGTGFSGQLPTVSSTNGITAFAGGGQGSAVQLTTVINRVTTVGTAADSVKLPAAVAGLQITVANAAAANSLNVFPATGDAINALSANAAFAVAANKTATFYCAVAGTWHAVLTA